jgi:hypothetical protein
MNYQKMMNCKKYNTAESAGPLSLLLTAGGMESGTPIDIHASEDAAIVLRETMTAAEMVGAIQSLRTITANLLIHLAKVCGPCDSCDMGCPCLQAEEAFPVPDALLEEAGIPKGAKLDVFAEEGTIHITAAEGPDLRDVPEDLLELFRQTGICLDELDGLMRENGVVYGG